MSVVLLHGFTGGPTSWDAVSGALVERGAGALRCLCPTIMGHEGAAAPSAHVGRPASFEDEIDRIARLLPRGALHLVGYSLGARLALGLAVRHRVRFESLTLIGVHPGLDDPAQRSSRAAADDALAAQLEGDGLAAFVDRWEALPMWATQRALSPGRLAAQRALRLSHDPGRLADALRVLSLGRMPSWNAALPDLDLPVTLVVGSADAAFRERAEATQARLPSAALVVVGDDTKPIGHNVPLEAPDELARVLLETMDV
jgi:2-succinyl-6-hydroxy-2,4-cyclohexadiene-1-carboxylate synthase